jgi:hypothetical protein
MKRGKAEKESEGEEEEEEEERSPQESMNAAELK